MAERFATAPLMLARIVARLVELELAGVLHRPSSFAPATPAASRGARLLWDWARVLDRSHRLVEEVLRPALRQPGREHRRRVQHTRGRPRGSVRWPATTQRQLRGLERALPFVCTNAERSLLAPENLLLALTLDEHGDRLERLLALLERERGYPPARLALQTLARTRAGAGQSPAWLAACRARLRQHAPPGLARELEALTRARTAGRPCAAPAWAKRLVELRQRSAPLPDPAALERLPPLALWRELCGLELLTQLRTHAALRQGSGWGFVSSSGAHYGPLAGTPAWVFSQPERQLLGVLVCEHTSWAAVEREALYWSWNPPACHREVDRWLVLHRAEDGPADLTRTRAPLSMRYLAFDGDRLARLEV